MPENKHVGEVTKLHEQITAREDQFAAALPRHIPVAAFMRAAMTAVSTNPELIEVDRRSLFNALSRCALDGLIPDGRQAALVIFRSKDHGKVASYFPMVAGIRKLVQQSGEITRFEQVVVYENDHFLFALGDNPVIKHEPALADRGRAIAVYSIAQFRDGTLSREVMTVDEVEAVRAMSRARDDGSGIWSRWWSEMARKTVAKRHAKVLPMSNDASDAIARDNASADDISSLVSALNPRRAPERPRRLIEELEAVGSTPPASGNEPRRRRGRQSVVDGSSAPPEPLTTPGIAEPEPEPELEPELGDQVVEATAEPIGAQDQEQADYNRGAADFNAGRAACLDADIYNNRTRYNAWSRGYSDARKASDKRAAK